MDTAQILSTVGEFLTALGPKVNEQLERSAQLQIKHKGRVDLVTETDIWCEKQVTEFLNSTYPEHEVIGEESVDELISSTGLSLEELCSSGIKWIVDPIDGTSNFANGIPHVGISLGMLVDGEMTLGLVYDVARGDLYAAAKGSGAYCNSKRINVSQKNEMIDSIVATGFPYDRAEKLERYMHTFSHFLVRTRDLRRYGAASLDFCWVACGHFDGYYEYNLKPWDAAAGALIVLEAGGHIGNFTTHSDEDFTLFCDSFICSGPGIYGEMLELAKECEE